MKFSGKTLSDSKSCPNKPSSELKKQKSIKVLSYKEPAFLLPERKISKSSTKKINVLPIQKNVSKVAS